MLLFPTSFGNNLNNLNVKIELRNIIMYVLTKKCTYDIILFIGSKQFNEESK